MKRTGMIVLWITAVVGLVVSGFALGFPVGQQIGFDRGSEWVMVQADITAREAGMSLPVYFEDGQLRVIIRQPADLHRRAQQQAAFFPDQVPVASEQPMEARTGLENDD